VKSGTRAPTPPVDSAVPRALPSLWRVVTSSFPCVCNPPRLGAHALRPLQDPLCAHDVASHPRPGWLSSITTSEYHGRLRHPQRMRPGLFSGVGGTGGRDLGKGRPACRRARGLVGALDGGGVAQHWQAWKEERIDGGVAPDERACPTTAGRDARTLVCGPLSLLPQSLPRRCPSRRGERAVVRGRTERTQPAERARALMLLALAH